VITQKIMDLLTHFAVVVVTILCAWNSLADGNSSTGDAFTLPFVVDIRIPGVRTSQVCSSVTT